MQQGLSRHALREHLFRLLFEAEFQTPDDMPEQIEQYLDAPPLEEAFEEPVGEKYRKELRKKFDRITEQISVIDGILNETARSWKTTRMNRVDLTILRLAVYEILFDEDIPDSVAINEAVELAKTYSEEDAPAFINGILATVVREKKPS